MMAHRRGLAAWCLVVVAVVQQLRGVAGEASLTSKRPLGRSPILNSLTRDPIVKRRSALSRGGATGPATSEDDDAGAMGETAAVASLVKTIIGGGMLALPAGMAAGKGTGVVPALVTVFAHATLSAYTYTLIGRAVERTGARDFRELWSLAFGARTAWMIDAMIAGVSTGAILTYGIFLGDLFSTMLPQYFTRTSAIVLLSLFPLAPLALAKDLSGLKASSYAGIVAILVSAFVIVLRALDGTYAHPNGVFADLASPKQTTMSLWGLSIASCVLFNMLSTAFMGHTNAVRAYRELKDRSRQTIVAAKAFVLSAILYASVMVAGYSTFGEKSQGLVLSNFHPKDVLALVTKIATAVSILGSHPLIFTSLRDCTLCLTGLVEKAEAHPPTFRAVALTLLIGTAVLAVFIPDAGFVVALNGASVGAFLICVVPCLVFLKVAKDQSVDQKQQHTRAAFPLVSNAELLLLKSLVAFGTFIALFGTVVTCLSTFTDLLN